MTKYITIGDETRSYVGWEKIMDLKPNVIAGRIRRGWSPCFKFDCLSAELV